MGAGGLEPPKSFGLGAEPASILLPSALAGGNLPRTTKDRPNNLAAHARPVLATMARVRQEMRAHIPSSIIWRAKRANLVVLCARFFSIIISFLGNAIP